jgi:carbonic anhydrase
MSLLNDILTFNEEFVSEKKYEDYITTKFPDKRLVILTCMDTRLVELVTKAINMKNGDVKIVRNAGAVVSHPFGSIMRSLLVAVYQLQADEVLVIGHHDCGMSGMNAEKVKESMKERGITEDTFDTLEYAGVKLDEWLTGFSSVEESVANSVNMIRNHPLMHDEVPVHGLVIDPATGKLDLVASGYELAGK